MSGALHFNLFLRHADAIKRANFTLFTSLLDLNEEREIYKSPFYHMFKLFSTNVRGKSLDTYVASDTFDGKKYKYIPYLDVSTSYSDDGQTMVINVVNRNMDEAIETDIISDTGEFAGEATVRVINSDDLNAEYTFEDRGEYSPETSTVTAGGESFQYSFAPHSFTQIEVEME